MLVKPLDDDVLLPRRHTSGAAGFDLRARASVVIPPGERACIATGIAIALPAGFMARVQVRDPSRERDRVV